MFQIEKSGALISDSNRTTEALLCKAKIIYFIEKSGENYDIRTENS